MTFSFASCADYQFHDAGIPNEISRLSPMNLLGPDVNVVEVREKDLQERPLGADQALAYKRSGGVASLRFNGPIDLIEMPPPDFTGDEAMILLPPLDP